MIRIKSSHGCKNEREYIFRILLHDFLGFSFELIYEDRSDIELSFEGKNISIDDSFFKIAEKKWLDMISMPKVPLEYWTNDVECIDINLVENKVPVLYGLPSLILNSKGCDIGIDIFGSCFFMLSRYEELICLDRDKHDRFPAASSVAFQQDFLGRPLVNEYLEILWSCCKYLWPNIERKPREFQFRVTVDVDQPYNAGVKSLSRQLKQIGGDLLKKKSIKKAFFSAINYFNAKRDDFRFDHQLSMFDWMMDINEKAGNRMDFYFITDHSDEKMDGCYSMDESVIRRLLCRINHRGHSIGLHPSYHTYKSFEQLKKEVSILRRALLEENIQQGIFGGRQHYLRWDPSETARNWASFDMKFDSSLGYAEKVGFRCGTCYEYNLYDLVNRQELSIKERPLIVMEVTLFSASYMGMGVSDEALKCMQKMKKICRSFDGDFVLLWHNSSFPNEKAKNLYHDICTN